MNWSRVGETMNWSRVWERIISGVVTGLIIVIAMAIMENCG